MCCFQERRCLGNILEQSLEKIWFSPLAHEIRKETLEGKLHPLCQTVSCPFYHRTNRVALDVYARTYPSQFEIDLPMQHCNIGGENPNDKNPACIMCERNMSWFHHQEDKLNEVCKKLRPYMKYVDAVHIQGIAEAFWKDRIFEITDLLDFEQHKNKVRISTTTNGTLMTEKRRKRFLDFPLSTITWSLDASTPETFKKIRRLDMYPRIVENLKAYAKERDPKNQFLHIHNNINTINIGEVVGMVELAAEVGVNCLDFNATYGDLPGICVSKDNIHLFREAQYKIMETSKKLGVYTTFMRNLVLDFEPAPRWEDIQMPMPSENTTPAQDFVQLQIPNA